MAEQIPVDVQQQVAQIFKTRQNTINDVTTKPSQNNQQKTLRAVDPFNIPLALQRLMTLLHLDGDMGARNDVKTRGYYLNIIV